MRKLTVHVVVVDIILVSSLLSSGIQAGDCRFGVGCAFPCRCDDTEETCDPVRGFCGISGCQKGLLDGTDWYGPGCLIGNVGLNKPATILENTGHAYKLNEGYPAVDGDVDQKSQKAPYSCSVIRRESPWWRVDLGESHRVYSVSYIVCTDICGNGAGAYVQLHVSDEPTINEQTRCGYYDQFLSSTASTVMITCTNNKTGQFVTLYRDVNDYESNFVALCEVVVMGVRLIDCTSCEEPSKCNDLTGCEKCPAGKRLPDCKDDCTAGEYGSECEGVCGNCTDPSSCASEDGICTDGCKLWSVGDTCHQYIDKAVINSVDSLLSVSSSDVTVSSVLIKWKHMENTPPSDLHQCYSYYVQYKKTVDSDWTTISIVQYNPDVDPPQATLDGLTASTEYQVTVLGIRTFNGKTDLLDNPSGSNIRTFTTASPTSGGNSFVIGGVVGGVIVFVLISVILIVVGIILRYRRKKKSKRKKELYSESNANTEAGRDATDIQRKDVLSTRENKIDERLPQNTDSYGSPPLDTTTYETIPCDIHVYENDEMSQINQTTYEMPIRDTTTFRASSSSLDMTTYDALSPRTLENENQLDHQ